MVVISSDGAYNERRMAHIVLAILAISFLMIIHETGHYVAARAFGLKVTVFSIGFGPALIKYQPKGSPTVFKLCLVPVLAYVRIAGQNPLEKTDPKDKTLYENASLRARAMTTLGGSLANYAFGSIVIFVLALAGIREEVPSSPMVIGEVEAASPADRAGLRPGDVVLAVEGKPIKDVTELAAITGPRPGLATSYLVRRGGQELAPIAIVPRNADGRGKIGVVTTFDTHVQKSTVLEAAKLAVSVPVSMSMGQIEGIKKLFFERTTEGMTGPVGMTREVAKQSEKGPYDFLVTLIALSVALGCFNLLPFPFLDGGRLVFLGAEAIMGQRPNRTFELVLHVAGLVLLLGLSAFVTMRDILG